MNNEQIQKPLIVELDNVRTEFMQFVQTLQSRGLPCYLIDMALSDIIAQVRNIAKSELEMAKKQMSENN